MWIEMDEESPISGVNIMTLPVQIDPIDDPPQLALGVGGGLIEVTPSVR